MVKYCDIWSGTINSFSQVYLKSCLWSSDIQRDVFFFSSTLEITRHPIKRILSPPTSAKSIAWSAWTYSRYWSRIFLSWMRSGFRLFIFLSIAMWARTLLLSSSSNFFLLLWISSTLDCSSSELLWILRGGKKFSKQFLRNTYIVLEVGVIWKHTSQFLYSCPVWGTCWCILCCSVLGFHTLPQRFE